MERYEVGPHLNLNQHYHHASSDLLFIRTAICALESVGVHPMLVRIVCRFRRVSSTATTLL
jgi:hypothetical protein